MHNNNKSQIFTNAIILILTRAEPHDLKSEYKPKQTAHNVRQHSFRPKRT